MGAWELQKIVDRSEHYFALLRIQLGLYRHGNEWANEELKKGRLALTRQQFEEAIRCNTRALLLNSGLSDAYFGRGLANYYLGKYRRSVRELTRAIKFQKNLTKAYSFRGLAKHKLAEHMGGVLDFTKVIELDPDYELAFSRRGMVYYELGMYPLSIADCNEAIRRKPNDILAFHVRGKSYMERKAFAAAIKDFSYQIARDSENIDCYFQRAIAYNNLQDHQSALQDCRRGIEIASAAPAMEDWIHALTNTQGTIYRGMREYPSAIGKFTEAIQLAPENLVPLRNRARAYFDMGEHRKAIDDFSVILEVTPQDSYTLGWRGAAYHNLGELERAIKDYKMAIRLDPGVQVVHENLAKAYDKLLAQNTSNDGGGTPPESDRQQVRCDRCDSKVSEGELTWMAGGLRCRRCISDITKAVIKIMRRNSISSAYYLCEFRYIMISGEAYKGKWNWASACFGIIWAARVSLLRHFRVGLIAFVISFNIGIEYFTIAFLAYFILMGKRGTYFYYNRVVHGKNNLLL